MQLRRQDYANSAARRRRHGGAIIEAALVLPIIFAVSFGAIEFGYFVFMKQAVQGAAREGARAAILQTATTAKVNTAVTSAMAAAGLDDSGYQVQITNGSTGATVNPATATAQTPIKVVVLCPWSNVSVGLRPLNLIKVSQNVIGTTVMMKE